MEKGRGNVREGYGGRSWKVEGGKDIRGKRGGRRERGIMEMRKRVEWMSGNWEMGGREKNERSGSKRLTATKAHYLNLCC